MLLASRIVSANTRSKNVPPYSIQIPRSCVIGVGFGWWILRLELGLFLQCEDNQVSIHLFPQWKDGPVRNSIVAVCFRGILQSISERAIYMACQ